MFISRCPVLQELKIIAASDDTFVEDISVRSESLRRFTLECRDWVLQNQNVEIYAPKLEYLSISRYYADSFIIHGISTCAKLNIDMIFNVDYEDASEKVIISELIISARTLEVIRGYFELEKLPEFSNMSRLDASFTESSWELFPMFLGSCPSLHHLVLEFESLPKDMKLSYVPPCFHSTLEFVELKTPSTFTQASNMMKLAIYFLSNCAALKMLKVNKSFGAIITKIKKIPKRSTGCKIVMV